MKNLTIALAFLMTFSLPVSAQDFQKGLAAEQAGDYATAIKEWKPLAEDGGSIKDVAGIKEAHAELQRPKIGRKDRLSGASSSVVES
tara:strand:+ start:1015 stop:1275 length:261 start_codon:yes stop_codon:yes gene_type:complete